jgi:tetratricopeptide (TPR) repeat protein
MGKHEEAIKNYSLALQIQLKINDEPAIANSYNNMAVALTELKKYGEALDDYRRCRAIQEKRKDKFGMSISNFNIGNVLASQNKYKEALTYSIKALEPSKELGTLDLTQAIEFNLSEIYSRLKDHRNALHHYKAYIAIRDSIFNEENTRKTVQAEMNFEFEKKEAATKLEQEKKEAVAIAESKKQKVIILSVCGILILVVFFAIYAFRSFLQKKKANIEISRQKEIIEEKQKEILDSIHYAKRIQKAIITSENYISRHIKKS